MRLLGGLGEVGGSVSKDVGRFGWEVLGRKNM